MVDWPNLHWIWDSEEKLSKVQSCLALLIPLLGLGLYGLNQRIETLRQRATEIERQENQRLRKVVSPRKLTPEQQSELAQMLLPFTGRAVVITLHTSQEEAANFRSQLESVFKEAKWQVSGPTFHGQDREGLEIIGRIDDPSDPAYIVSKFFLRLGIQHRPVRNKAAALNIFIGNKETVAVE